MKSKDIVETAGAPEVRTVSSLGQRIMGKDRRVRTMLCSSTAMKSQRKKGKW